MKDHYLALAEHVPQVDNLGSYDMAVTPALIVHGILAFTALAFIAAVFLGAFDARRVATPFASRNCKKYSG
jgi:hypothetical protein